MNISWDTDVEIVGSLKFLRLDESTDRMPGPPSPDPPETLETDARVPRERGRGSARPESRSTGHADNLNDSDVRRILFLDDDRRRAEIFLERNPKAVWIQTAQECIDLLTEEWDEVYLDHDLGGEHYVDVERTDCGMEVVRRLCREPMAHLTSTRFIIHSHNLAAALMMVLLMRETGYDAEFLPFGFILELDPFTHPMDFPASHPTTKTGSLRDRIGRLFSWITRRVAPGKNRDKTT